MLSMVAGINFKGQDGKPFIVNYQIIAIDPEMNPQNMVKIISEICNSENDNNFSKSPEEFLDKSRKKFAENNLIIAELDRGASQIINIDCVGNGTIAVGPLVLSCILQVEGKDAINGGVKTEKMRAVTSDLFDNDMDYKIRVNMNDEISYYDKEIDIAYIGFTNYELKKYRLEFRNASNYFFKMGGLFGRSQRIGIIGRISQIMWLGHVEPNPYERIMDIDLRNPYIQLAGLLMDFCTLDNNLSHDIHVFKYNGNIDNSESADEFIDKDCIKEYTSIHNFYTDEVIKRFNVF